MLETKKAHIRIISPSGRFDHSLLLARLEVLRQKFNVSYHKLEPDPSWPFLAGSFQDRLAQLSEALLADDVDVILGARGGFGASDLLPHLPWGELKKVKPKVVIGFSDITALQSALFSQLGWPHIHGPMPGTKLWDEAGGEDVEALVRLMEGRGEPMNIPLVPLGGHGIPSLEGWSYGGCLSVLTNLIGTPYFPRTLYGSLLYWEDIGEHPARILRFINQWTQSKALDGVKGIILGRFADCEVKGQFTEDQMKAEIASRLRIPVWLTPLFGHCAPNWPMPVGYPLRIERQSLSWKLPPQTTV